MLKRFDRLLISFLTTLIFISCANIEGEKSAVKTSPHGPYKSEPVSSKNVEENSVKENIPKLIEMAANGDPDSQFTLGTKYYTGEGVSRNDYLAMEYYRRAAVQGHVMAQLFLGFNFDSIPHIPII